MTDTPRPIPRAQLRLITDTVRHLPAFASSMCNATTAQGYLIRQARIIDAHGDLAGWVGDADLAAHYRAQAFELRHEAERCIDVSKADLAQILDPEVLP